MEDNSSCKVVDIGTRKIKMFDGAVRTLDDVRLVLNLKRSLISLSTLDSKVTIVGDIVVITSSLSDDDVTKLWHMLLGHMSENGMTDLSKQGLLDGKSINELKFYENCILNKHKRVMFSKVIYDTKGTLDYIHSDL
ncbi:uncharacterized mitochondrial protein AtMg00300-like [Impatiens glandulifera]|uniref:uncharacterized mitochondrial protein AtMg00300-like n=1 Tax=Impatiens glandulifera TaxID=253017 RepID=UPI001FB09FDA|nr:uncharacterized mitochondrial protein AtMg00300-like [Impatiens glandulifera]